MKFLISVLMVLHVIIFLPFSVYAAEEFAQPEEDKWNAETTIYMFLATDIEIMPMLNGMSPSQPIKTDVFELIDKLGLFDGLYAFSAHHEMWKDQLGLLFNVDYLKITGGGGAATPVARVMADLETISLNADAALGYELAKIPLSDSNNYQNFRLIGWAGVQYNYLKEEMNISLVPFVPPVPGAQIPLGGDEDWVNPIVGLGASIQLTEKLRFGIRGQTGGFGIGGTADENWWAIGGFDYRFSGRWSAKVAYKYWSYDYKSNTLGIDMVMQGPWVGVSFHW